MSNFWDCIPLGKKGRVYDGLSKLYGELCGEILEEPDGLRGEPERKPDIINAPDYKEMEELEVQREIREKPHHQERID